MGAKIEAIKQLFGFGVKKVVSEVKSEAPKQIKEVSAETVKDMQSAEAAYGKANVSLQSGKKVYVKPEAHSVKLQGKYQLNAASGPKTNGESGGWSTGTPGEGSGFGGDESGTIGGSRPVSPYDSFWEDLTQ